VDGIPNAVPSAPEPANTGTSHTLAPAVPGPESWTVMQQLLLEALQRQTTPPDPRDQRTVQEVVDAYLRDGKDEITARTYEMRALTLNRFAQAFGTRKVSECRPIDLKRWLAVQTNWASAYTKQRCRGDIQRALNWAVAAGLIRENPFHGFHLSEQPTPSGRDMQPEEFQAILRSTDPSFRRFLVALKLSGARPGEVAALQWKHIDWDKAVAVLPEHKTARKTGKPRVILLAPPLLKLLKIIRRDHHGPAAVELRRILTVAGGRAKIRDVVEPMRALGFSYRALYRARQAIGATYRRVGGWAEKGYTVYELGPDAKPVKDSAYMEYVFLNSKGQPWQRTSLTQKLKRLRKRLGLDRSCKLHSLRHFFITEAIRRGVGLKALATLVGHSTTSMIERVYAHIDNDLDFLHRAVLQAISKPPEPPALAEDGKPAARTLSPEILEQFGDSVNRMITRLVELETAEAARKKERERQPPAPPKLNPHHQIAYDAAQWAIAQNPCLVHGTDLQVYEWLHTRPEYHGQLPPTAVAFCRYLRTARRLIDQCGKRERRRKGWQPPETNGQAEAGGVA
jgi:integrase